MCNQRHWLKRLRWGNNSLSFSYDINSDVQVIAGNGHMLLLTLRISLVTEMLHLIGVTYHGTSMTTSNPEVKIYRKVFHFFHRIDFFIHNFFILGDSHQLLSLFCRFFRLRNWRFWHENNHLWNVDWSATERSRNSRWDWIEELKSYCWIRSPNCQFKLPKFQFIWKISGQKNINSQSSNISPQKEEEVTIFFKSSMYESEMAIESELKEIRKESMKLNSWKKESLAFKLRRSKYRS